MNLGEKAINDTGKWLPMEDKYADDRFIITHTGYLVDTETDEVYLTIQGFLNFVNKEIGIKLSDDEKRYYHEAYYYKRESKNLSCTINDLKDEIKRLSDDRYAYKQDWKHAAMDCEILEQEMMQLQDENYELKQTVAQLVKESKETSQKKEKYNIQPYIIMKKGDVE